MRDYRITLRSTDHTTKVIRRGKSLEEANEMAKAISERSQTKGLITTGEELGDAGRPAVDASDTARDGSWSPAA